MENIKKLFTQNSSDLSHKEIGGFMDQESWSDIEDFPDYSISSYGRVRNDRDGCQVATHLSNFGNLKVMMRDSNHERKTRGVGLLVAKAFKLPPDELSDTVVMLDGNRSNVAAYNLVWRPRWFALMYTRQFHQHVSVYFTNVFVLNVVRGLVYDSVVDAATTEGLLFEDVWKSTYTGKAVYPHRSVFKVIDGV